LELIRRRRIRASQERAFGPILIHLLDPTPLGQAEHEYDNGFDERPERPPPSEPDPVEPTAGSAPSDHAPPVVNEPPFSKAVDAPDVPVPADSVEPVSDNPERRMESDDTQ
jgi:hypothetical protein